MSSYGLLFWLFDMASVLRMPARRARFCWTHCETYRLCVLTVRSIEPVRTMTPQCRRSGAAERCVLHIAIPAHEEPAYLAGLLSRCVLYANSCLQKEHRGSVRCAKHSGGWRSQSTSCAIIRAWAFGLCLALPCGILHPLRPVLLLVLCQVFFLFFWLTLRRCSCTGMSNDWTVASGVSDFFDESIQILW